MYDILKQNGIRVPHYAVLRRPSGIVMYLYIRIIKEGASGYRDH